MRYHPTFYDYRDPACPEGYDPDAELDEYELAMEQRAEAEREERE